MTYFQHNTSLSNDCFIDFFVKLHTIYFVTIFSVIKFDLKNTLFFYLMIQVEVFHLKRMTK